ACSRPAARYLEVMEAAPTWYRHWISLAAQRVPCAPAFLAPRGPRWGCRGPRDSSDLPGSARVQSRRGTETLGYACDIAVMRACHGPRRPAPDSGNALALQQPTLHCHMREHGPRRDRAGDSLRTMWAAYRRGALP